MEEKLRSGGNENGEETQSFDEAEQRYQTLVDLLPEAVVVHRDGVILSVNSYASSLAGVPAEELIGKPVHVFVSDEFKDRVLERIQAAMNGEVSQGVAESRIIDASGRQIDVEAISAPVPYEGQIAVLTVIRDITDRKIAQRKLDHSSDILRLVLDSLPALIYVADMETYEILFINEFGRESFGSVAGQLCYRSLQNGIDDPCSFCTNDRLLDGEGNSVGVVEWEFVNTSNGRWYSIRDLAIPWLDGRMVRLEIALDVTEKKRIEKELEEAGEKLKELNVDLEEKNVSLYEQVINEVEKQKKQEYLLVQQSKLAAMGEMIGAISHQWRQPLNGLGLILQDIQDTYEYGEMDSAYLADAVQSSIELIDLMSKTIDDFRGFLKPSDIQGDFLPCQATQSVMRLLESQLKNYGVDYSLECQDEDLRLHGSETEFKQVLLNLVNNARDAIQSKHRSGDSEEGTLRGTVVIRNFVEKDTHVIQVEDDGTGIDPSIMDRIFEPYFTTREIGQGTGIGLYMSRIIVENRLHGRIGAHNTGNGALFEVRLPAYSDRT